MIKTEQTVEQIDNLVLAKLALENYKAIIDSTSKIYDFELLTLVLNYISGSSLTDEENLQISEFITNYTEEEHQINIHGQDGHLENLLNTFKRKLPTKTAAPTFKRAQGKFSTMYTIARKTDRQVPITIKPKENYQYIIKQNNRKAA